MAPVKGKRPSIRTRLTTSNPPAATRPATPGSGLELGLASSKRDKRTIKHSQFVSKIEKTSSKSKKRRRKPSKRLVANLESLADALPETGAYGEEKVAEVGDARIKHKSLKSRPGATKRKEKIERMERERFGLNMAQMLVPSNEATDSTAPTSGCAVEGGSADNPRQQKPAGNTWGALRQFISSTMEQKPEFREKQASSA